MNAITTMLTSPTSLCIYVSLVCVYNFIKQIDSEKGSLIGAVCNGLVVLALAKIFLLLPR